MLPIQLKLRRRKHKEIAYAQDLVVETLYNLLPKAVIHGGTAIWRCYQGNRFSEDIDIYIKKEEEKINRLFSALEGIGFQVEKRRIKQNSLYSTLKFNASIVRLEALFKIIKNPLLKEYETSEGNLINVFTLTSEELLNEKIATYSKRKKIRDLYDIFFLLRHVKDNRQIEEKLRRFIKNFNNPVDEQNLKVIIITGIIPSTKEMLEYIKRWVK